MRYLLLGKNGQVGWELQRALAPLGEMVALDRAGSGALCGDLADLEGLRRTMRQVRPDVVINAAAYTAVDKAESEQDLARVINAEAPAVLAQEAAESGAWLVHYSTDYVFDGTGANAWKETDPVAPLNVYGVTKLEGERAIQRSGCKHLIFRTSWVYGVRGNNFARTMLRLAKERDRLTVIADQIGSPTGADLLADVTAHAIRSALHRSEVSGLYHLAAAGETSWHAYASFVLDFARRAGIELKVVADAVLPVPTTEYPTPAKRPNNSRLDTRKLQETFGLQLPNWQFGVTRMLTQILEK